MGQGTQTEEAGENIDAEGEDYEEDAAIEEEEPVEFADPEDDEFEYDRCDIFSHFYVYCISLHYIENGQITPIPDP